MKIFGEKRTPQEECTILKKYIVEPYDIEPEGGDDLGEHAFFKIVFELAESLRWIRKTHAEEFLMHYPEMQEILKRL